MLSDVEVLKYITAEGMINLPIPSQDDALYLARKKFLSIVYQQGWLNNSPYNTWMAANRVFFTTPTTFSYTIGNITFTITAGPIFAMQPQEYSIALAKAASLGITLSTTNFAAWVGFGSLSTFYW